MKKIAVFLDDFHHGGVNHLIHFTGIALYGYGIGIENWFIVAVAPLVMEIGHVYNYVVGRHRELMLQTLPMQIVAWFVFIAIAYVFIEVF